MTSLQDSIHCQRPVFFFVKSSVSMRIGFTKNVAYEIVIASVSYSVYLKNFPSLTQDSNDHMKNLISEWLPEARVIKRISLVSNLNN